MTNCRPIRYSLSIFILLIFSGSIQAAELTQRDWMQGLVDALGFSYGLPEEPADSDYLNILSGDRVFRLEVESMIGETEPVSIKTFKIFGSYRGDGWVSGVTKPVVADFSFLIPRSGDYRVSTSVRNSPHEITIGSNSFVAHGGEAFTAIDLGISFFEAGEQLVEMGVPAGGAIDFIDLIGENAPPIEPTGGWKLDSPLTMEVISETLVKALGLTDFLPGSIDKKMIELETSGGALSGLRAVNVSYFGRPSGGKWLRGGANTSNFSSVLLAGEPGYYRLGFRGIGSGIAFNLFDRYQFERDCKPYLSDVELGVFEVDDSGMFLDVALPPRGGADAIIVEPMDASPTAFRTLAGLAGDDQPVSAEFVNRVLTFVSTVGSPF